MEYEQRHMHSVNYHNYSYHTSEWLTKYNEAMFPVFTIQTIIKAILLIIIFRFGNRG